MTGHPGAEQWFPVGEGQPEVLPFPNGTKLVVYSDETYEINGYKLSPGHPNPVDLAKAVDSVKPRGTHMDTDRAWNTYTVLEGCEALYRQAMGTYGSPAHSYCSANFVRAVIKDFDDATTSFGERPMGDQARDVVDMAANILGVCPGPTNCAGTVRKLIPLVPGLAGKMSITPNEFCHLPGKVHATVGVAGVAIGLAGAGPVGEAVAVGIVGLDIYCHATEGTESVIIPLRR